MGFDINQAIADSTNSGNSRDSTAFQKIFNASAPPISYLSGKGPCQILVLPPHASTGADQTLTSGGFRLDKDRGVYPTLGGYALDWVYVYKDVGNSPDMKRRKSILAVNMVRDANGNMTIKPEQEWGQVYSSPMYKLREYLWRLGGEHHFDRQRRMVVPRVAVDFSNAKVRRALELVPPQSNIGDPIGRPTRCLFVQGLMVTNAGNNYMVDENKQPCWPQHRLLMISQITAIKSKVNARQKEGFYDMFFDGPEGIDGMDPESVIQTYGDVRKDLAARIEWEKAAFKHANFATEPKLVTFSSYPGANGISSYECKVSDAKEVFDGGIDLPESVKESIRPIGDYIIETNEQLQAQWLAELFAGDEWALIEAGVMQPNSARIAVPAMGQVRQEIPVGGAPDMGEDEITEEVVLGHPPKAAMAAPPAAPRMPTAPRAPTAVVPPVPAAPKAPMTPTIPSSVKPEEQTAMQARLSALMQSKSKPKA